MAPSVVALAGRRVHAEGSPLGRFPESRVAAVRRELARLLVQERAVALVSSGACGTDLIGLEEAARLGLRRRIVLPFAPERFRQRSVIDCPGDWATTYDRLIEEARAAGDLVVLGNSAEAGHAAFLAANDAIIREAQALASQGAPDAPRRLVAVIAWEGQARADDDATEAFRARAERAGFVLRTVLTTVAAVRP